MAHIWLTGELENMRSKKSVFSLASKRSQDHDAIQARLGEFYLHQIETDSSPVYGEGFRKGYAAVRQFGLARTLEHLRHTRDKWAVSGYCQLFKVTSNASIFCPMQLHRYGHWDSVVIVLSPTLAFRQLKGYCVVFQLMFEWLIRPDTNKTLRVHFSH